MKSAFKRALVCIIIVILGWYSIKNINNTKVYENSGNINNPVILINSKFGLDKDYVPKDLSIPEIPFSDESIDEEKHVAGIMKGPLEELVNEAKNQGIFLFGNSGYRSYKSQEEVYEDRVRSQGRRLADAYVAKPGFSEHQTGLCMDITNQEKFFVEGTVEADWLKENCSKFGFIIRYPKGKEDVTGKEYEPWHIRYVGKDVAKYIYDNGITLEEYIEKR